VIIPVLDVIGVDLRFGGLRALDQVQFRVERGEIYAVIGPNGAGKTSLFNCITGIYPPSAGRILICGHEAVACLRLRTVLAWIGVTIACALIGEAAINANGLWDAAINDHLGTIPFPWHACWKTARTVMQPSCWTILPALAGAVVGALGFFYIWQANRRSPERVACAGVARTFQNIRLFRDMSVLDNVLVGSDRGLFSRLWGSALRLPSQRREEVRVRAHAQETLTLVGLAGKGWAIASSLSYGHQRRLEIARALASAPSILLLDEPAAGMNRQESADLMILIRRIRDRGVTVLLIEHDMHVVMGISDRICVLHYGNKIAEGTPEQIRANPQVIAAYLGDDHA
jgi:ABC-type branched-subunit amino acid transport system ATPase component